ncbi:MAG TPA: DUF4097 family beta strand repeat-containing protein [Chloroflexia bacterium]|nr:DUF4097 family beta strand repeat-containing protein [Chloroflexia bacterium]
MNATTNENGIELAVDAAQPTSLTIEQINGDLTIQGWAQPVVQITADDLDADVALAEVVEVRQQGNQIALNLTMAGRRHRLRDEAHNARDLAEVARLLQHLGRHLDLQIHLPHRAEITVRTATGDITVRQIQGKLSVQSASGDVQLQEIEGSVLIRGASTDVTIARLRGRLGVHTMSGDLIVTGAELAALNLKTVSGDIQLAGALHPAEDYEIQTVSGDVALELPANRRATVDFQTVSGDFSCQLPHQVDRQGRRQRRVAINGGGEAYLRLQTTSGDVQLQSGAPAAAGTASTPAGDEEIVPAETRRFSPGEVDVARAAVGADAIFHGDPAAAGEPPPTQRLDAGDRSAPRQSPEMVILAAIESGAMSVDEGLRRLNELAG